MSEPSRERPDYRNWVPVKFVYLPGAIVLLLVGLSFINLLYSRELPIGLPSKGQALQCCLLTTERSMRRSASSPDSVH